MEDDAAESDPAEPKSPLRRDGRPTVAPAPNDRDRLHPACILAVLATLLTAPALGDDALTESRRAGILRYGCDAEGGGPYAYPDPSNPKTATGFEVELMGLLAEDVGAKPVLVQGQWDALLPTLGASHVDLVVNGYELTPERAARYLATRPYYVYQLQLMTPRGGPLRSCADLERPRPDGKPWRLSLLGGSAPEAYLREHFPKTVSISYFNGATDAMMAVKNGQADATLQDLPAARFYIGGYPALELAGPPVGHGYYVMFARKGDDTLRDALDHGIGRLIQTGQLRRLYEKYGIWTDAQDELTTLDRETVSAMAVQDSSRGWTLIRRYGPTLLTSAALTIVLSCASMPLAMLIGLMVALGRLYGPKPVRWLMAAYVELLRGTPLMLQLFVLFFLLPGLGIHLEPLAAGIAGLAINYSAYEAEIYRAGLQAIPPGQMEAALALGMSRGLALRRVIVPQAVRIVIPPVTNDFIALFKDTSVCSVISLVELTKRYSILANSTGGVLEFAAATAVLYLGMSLPLSYFSRWFERKLGAEGVKGGHA